MSEAEEQGPYRVEPGGGQFQVLDEEGRVIIACGSEANATQYAVVMNEAYRRGYRAGTRTRRKSGGN